MKKYGIRRGCVSAILALSMMFSQNNIAIASETPDDVFAETIQTEQEDLYDEPVPEDAEELDIQPLPFVSETSGEENEAVFDKRGIKVPIPYYSAHSKSMTTFTKKYKKVIEASGEATSVCWATYDDDGYWMGDNDIVADIKAYTRGKTIFVYARPKIYGNIYISLQGGGMEYYALLLNIGDPKISDAELNYKVDATSDEHYYFGSSIYSYMMSDCNDIQPKKVTSSNKKILKVKGNIGSMIVKRHGRVKVTAYYGKHKLSAHLDIKIPGIEEDKVTVKKGSAVKLNLVNSENVFGRTLVWKVKNPNCATVAEDGTVTAIKKGKTTVSLYLGDELYDTCTINVKK